MTNLARLFIALLMIGIGGAYWQIDQLRATNAELESQIERHFVYFNEALADDFDAVANRDSVHRRELDDLWKIVEQIDKSPAVTVDWDEIFTEVTVPSNDFIRLMEGEGDTVTPRARSE